ncbi:MAG: hypothetical protein ACKVOU_08375 [Cytophagales bacterium]
MNWLKQNLFNVLNLIVLVYVIFELENIKAIALQTGIEAQMSNIKLDYVESDVNSETVVVDSLKRRIENDMEKSAKRNSKN